MSNKSINRMFIVIGVCVSLAAQANVRMPRRISGQIVDLGKVTPVFMVAGMATVIEIPTPVTDAFPGDSQSVKRLPEGNSQNEVRLVLASVNAKPTNYIVRSGKKKYVFDIIPSKDIHQDFVEIISSYGGPEYSGADAVLIADSSHRSTQKEEIK